MIYKKQEKHYENVESIVWVVVSLKRRVDIIKVRLFVFYIIGTVSINHGY